MANKKHLALLKSGVRKWNKWRKGNPRAIPDLMGAELSGANISEADLSEADLRRVNLRGANLSNANLSDANLIGANLSEANLSGTNLNRANLSKADLMGTTFSKATLGGTVFANDLSQCIGLEDVRHFGRSHIDIATIYQSRGRIPHNLLSGAGVPDNFIEYLASLVWSEFDYYSCFISYSTKDEAFAERLYADLQTNGVRCWFAPEDFKIGQKIRPGIDEAIRIHDKLLLVLSKASVKSSWVEKEVETAFDKEREEKTTVLFPVRLDEAVFQTNVAWAADIRRTRHIGDFRNWQNHAEFKKAFERLMRDLKTDEL